MNEGCDQKWTDLLLLEDFMQSQKLKNQGNSSRNMKVAAHLFFLEAHPLEKT